MARINVRPKAFPLIGIFEKVKFVMEAFKETENTLPKAQFKAKPPAEIVGTVLTSFKPVIVGVVIAGLVASAFAPEPVEVVTPVPPLATTSVADKDAADPEVFWFSVGKVQFAKFPEVGVPRTGVTSVGDVSESVSPLCNS